MERFTGSDWLEMKKDGRGKGGYIWRCKLLCGGEAVHACLEDAEIDVSRLATKEANESPTPHRNNFFFLLYKARARRAFLLFCGCTLKVISPFSRRIGR